MDDHRAAGDEQLRPRRRNPNLPFRREREFHPDEIRGPLLVIDVGLREWCLANGTPERRPFAAVEGSFRPELEEDRLAERSVLVGIRVVRVLEVRRHADADRELEQAVADRLDLLSALLDERLAVPTVERLARLLLDRALDVDSVPVEAEREEHGASEHALRPGDHVDHRIRHHGADVPRAARIRRRRVPLVGWLFARPGAAIPAATGAPRPQDVFPAGRPLRPLPAFWFP